jgi:peptide/nickel transport system ATP-binding protein
MNNPLIKHSTLPLFQAKNISTSFNYPRCQVRILKDISFSVDAGKAMALVGESGAGKSVLAMTLLNALPHWSKPSMTGELWLNGMEISSASKPAWKVLRRRKLGYIPQDAMHALAPYLKIDLQLKEMLPKLSKPASNSSHELISRVGLESLDNILDYYPFELSGGMRQQVLILIALARGPELLIADEPTSAIDVTLQARLLNVFAWAKAARNMGLLLITHDLRAAARVADEIAVIYSGKIIEQATKNELLNSPRHPYSRLLVLSARGWDIGSKQQIRVPSQEKLYSLDSGCEYAVNCNRARRKCWEQVPPGKIVSDSHQVSCWYPLPLQPLSYKNIKFSENLKAKNNNKVDKNKVSIRLRDLTIQFKSDTDLVNSRTKSHKVVNGLNLDLYDGESLALVGESGSGKTITCLSAIGLIKPVKGESFILGKSISSLNKREQKWLRKRIQMVFQSPSSSLNPLMTIGEILAEPQQIHFKRTFKQTNEINLDLLDALGMSTDILLRKPDQLSQGQRQRVAIARCLAFEPRILIADEPLSSQDMINQLAVIDVLEKWQQKQNAALIFVSHDLGTVRVLANRVAVLCSGVIVEEANSDELFMRPLHPYTKLLINAISVLDNTNLKTSTTTNAYSEFGSRYTGSGCPFEQRCPESESMCRQSPPPTLRNISWHHKVACHHF